MLSDNRYKQLMKQVGMPNSRSLLQVLEQVATEAALLEREECAKIAERYEPDEKQDYVLYASSDIRSHKTRPSSKLGLLNEQQFQKIADEVEQQWQMGGLSSGLYYDFAHECTRRYCNVGGITDGQA